MGNRDKLRAANQAKQSERLNPTAKPQIESLTDDIKKRAEEKLLADAKKEEKAVEPVIKSTSTSAAKPYNATQDSKAKKETKAADAKEATPSKKTDVEKTVEVKKEVSIMDAAVDIKKASNDAPAVKKHAGGRPKKALSETRNNTCKQISVWLPNEIVDFLQEEKVYYDNNITKCIAGIIKKEMKKVE